MYPTDSDFDFDTGNELSDPSELDELLRAGVHLALETTNFGDALAGFRGEFSTQVPRLAATLPADGERSIAFMLFREIWNHVPRPDHNWQPVPLSKPERNGLCPCQSGAKYKQCCGQIDRGSLPFDAKEFSFLGYVLETVPVSQYKTLPFKRLMPEEVAHVAEQWHEAGRTEAARLLLEGLLASGGKFDERHEYAFDTLCGIYLDVGEGDRRVELVERFMHEANKHLKATAMQRRSSMLADDLDFERAWAVFKQAQRVLPDDPSLAHLELSLLAAQGELERAGERASYWAARLRKQGLGGERIVEFLDAVASDPQILLDIMEGDAEDTEFDEIDVSVEDTGRLLALIDNMPAPACHYKLRPHNGQAGPLEARPDLAELEREWMKRYTNERADDDPVEDIEWLAWLEDNPLAWQSFNIVEEILDFLREADTPEQFDDELDRAEERLLEYAVTLLRVNIHENAAIGCTLDWGWVENRAALRLLSEAIDLQGRSERALELNEWLVLELNPTDNTGHRVALVHRLCAAGRVSDALGVLDRYSDDVLAGMMYGHVLALALANRRDLATAALAKACQQHPDVLKTLLAPEQEPEEIDFDSVTLEDDQDAWFYRMEWFYVWKETGAMEWLTLVAGTQTAAPEGPQFGQH